MNLGPAEVLVVLVIALLVFGPTRLPEIGRQVGRGVRELRKLQDSVRRDLDEVLADDHSAPDTAPGDVPPTLPPREIETAQPPESAEAPEPASGEQSKPPETA
jgi:TatA/E family protein of Tat protein translocase